MSFCSNFFELNRRFVKNVSARQTVQLEQNSNRSAWEANDRLRKVSELLLNFDSRGKPQKICLFDAIYWDFLLLNFKNWKKFQENMHLCFTGNMNRLSWLFVVFPSKVWKYLVNVYFSRQWLKLRISDVIMLEIYRTKEKIVLKCFGKQTFQL